MAKCFVSYVTSEDDGDPDNSHASFSKKDLELFYDDPKRDDYAPTYEDIVVGELKAGLKPKHGQKLYAIWTGEDEDFGAIVTDTKPTGRSSWCKRVTWIDMDASQREKIEARIAAEDAELAAEHKAWEDEVANSLSAFLAKRPHDVLEHKVNGKTEKSYRLSAGPAKGLYVFAGKNDLVNGGYTGYVAEVVGKSAGRDARPDSSNAVFTSMKRLPKSAKPARVAEALEATVADHLQDKKLMTALAKKTGAKLDLGDWALRHKNAELYSVADADDGRYYMVFDGHYDTDRDDAGNDYVQFGKDALKDSYGQATSSFAAAAKAFTKLVSKKRR